MTTGLFQDPFLDEFGTWALGYIPYGGADYGEIEAVASAVGDGDDSAFYDAWVAYGDRALAEADEAAAAGHPRSASEWYLKASCFFASAYHPLYGTPIDPRLPAAYDKQMDAFLRGLALAETPGRPVSIPYLAGRLPGYFLPAAGRGGETLPLVVLNNGYDATMTDLYFASAVAASRRGYHVLMFDGPGQGGALYHDGLTLRPDWEVVVTAVMDAVLEFPEVDPDRVALHGWSLGGYLAPRAATAEHRLAAVIADPAQWDLGSAMARMGARLGMPAGSSFRPDQLDDATLHRLQAAIDGDRALHWSIVKRGFWANGVSDLRGFLTKTMEFTYVDTAKDIRCPTLLTRAENDPLAADAPVILDALTCPKTLLTFTAAEGAGDHCEMKNRSLLNRRVLDWLDDTLRPTA